MQLLFALLGEMCISAMIAYLLGRSKKIMHYAMHPYSLSAWALFTVIFSSLSIISSYYGTRIDGALASTRIVGTLMGGIIGGPYVGLSVGIIGGLHRYSLGGFTALSCAAATVIAGLLAGLVRYRIGFLNLKWQMAAMIALSAEIIQKGLTLAFAKPFASAWNFESVAALPTASVTVIGTVLFVLIMKDMRNQSELAGAKAAQISLAIANETLPFLKEGLTTESAKKTAEIITRLAGEAAVCISDTEKTLGFAGISSDHHLCGHPINFSNTFKVLETGQTITFQDGPYCGHPDCPLTCGVIVPLTVKNVRVGTIRIYKTKNNGLLPVDIQIAEGVAKMLSTQIALADMEQQRSLREQAEFKALQAQINPHFLFNTLSIIMCFCRTEPETARKLLASLSDMLHFTFAKHDGMVTLGEEFTSVEAYLNIVKARFGSRLTIEAALDDDLKWCLIPAFTIQPIVENAVKHGLFPKTSDCYLNIDISKQDDNLIIVVKDNGIGMNEAKRKILLSLQSEGIGIANVVKRIRGLYKERSEISVMSEEGRGTIFTIKIPFERRAAA
ncbi:MAG: LytS/YhcK type 5TM receptor domain-containing protein [Acidaminococcaceae bacterium]|nr:LytS/YhcK type 5TM receptor domain-containing protein [Acidaminococcaceae bacterium]